MGQMGRLLMAAGYHDMAERCFQHAVHLQPDDARWRYLLGHVYRLRHEPARAAEAFAAALRVHADDVAALIWLGNAYLELGDPDRAEPIFERALARQPRLAPALHGLGRVALARREFVRAVESLTQALHVDPHASVIHRSLALAYQGTGDVRRADAHMRQHGTIDAGLPDPQLQALSSLLDSSASSTAGAAPWPREVRDVHATAHGQVETPRDEFSDGPYHEQTTAAFGGR
jgi:tetratricopeptide (TPR) repeat protein